MSMLTTQNLRSVLRREHTNLEKKVTLILMMTNMYRLLDPDFYTKCCLKVVREAFTEQTKQEQVLVQLV
jgi:hypothetical protein